MHKIIKSVKKSFFLLFIFEFTLFANPVNLDFYGIITTDADSNMMNMTEDMFLKQMITIKVKVKIKKMIKIKNKRKDDNLVIVLFI